LLFSKGGRKDKVTRQCGHAYVPVPGECAMGHRKPRQGKGREKPGPGGYTVLEFISAYTQENSHL